MYKFQFCPQCKSELVEKSVDGEPRVACPSQCCGFVHWGNPTPVLAGLVEYEGDIILGRNALWPEGMFGLISGFMEAGEAPEEGMAREVEEELGLQTSSVELIGNYPFVQMNQVLLCYHVRAEGLVLRGDELAEIKKVPPAELVPWRTGTGFAVRDWMMRRNLL